MKKCKLEKIYIAKKQEQEYWKPKVLLLYGPKILRESVTERGAAHQTSPTTSDEVLRITLIHHGAWLGHAPFFFKECHRELRI